MASLRKTQNGNFIICFRYLRKHYQRALKTKEPDAAKAAMGKVEHTLYRLTNGDLSVPHGVDPGDYTGKDHPSVPQGSTVAVKTISHPD